MGGMACIAPLGQATLCSFPACSTHAWLMQQRQTACCGGHHLCAVHHVLLGNKLLQGTCTLLTMVVKL